MEKTHLKQLLHQYLTGGISDSDRLMLEEWVIGDKDPEAATAVLRDLLEATEGNPALIPSGWEEMHHAITAIDKLAEAPAHRIPLYRRWWAAASIVLVLGIGAYIWIANKSHTETGAIAQTTVDIAPGSEGAILTLADGRQVVLDSLDNGVIASQNGSEAVLKNGLLEYDLTGKSTEAIVYNTITTPNGRQFAVTLPDGTRVWLNAASSIRYPTVFNGQERRVVATGEVYMEVAADKTRPFLVNVNDMEVQVLGTSFNINAYNDEPAIRTTLLDGSIKLLRKTPASSSIILKPGQQVIFDENITINEAVDVEHTISWKNGVFNFNGATLEEFMRQIARWYDLKIIYQGAIPHKIFKGKIGRDLQLSQITKLLTQFNIKYQLLGNTITIEP